MIRIPSWVVLAALPILGHAQPTPEPSAVVQIAIAEQQRLTPETWAPGSIVSRFDSDIAAEVEGALLNVAEVGDRVAEGETLGQIDDQSHQIQLRNDEAVIKRLEVNIEFLDRQLARFTELVASNSSAETEVDRVRMEREMAVHELSAAQAARDQTLYLIERTRIRAPFAGVVAAQMRQPGEYIRGGDALVRLVDESRLEARVQAPVSSVRHINPGTEVAIVNDQSEALAPIRALVPVGDERSRMVELRISLQAGDWIIGEAIRASIPSAAEVQAVTVPRDALVLRDSKVYVFRVGPGGAAERLQVETGASNADRISVRGALEPGDQVVVRGAESLQPGQLVKVIGMEADPAPSASAVSAASA